MLQSTFQGVGCCCIGRKEKKIVDMYSDIDKLISFKFGVSIDVQPDSLIVM